MKIIMQPQKEDVYCC